MRNDILGQWNTEWSYFWSELSRTPTLEGHKMEFLLKVLVHLYHLCVQSLEDD